MQHYVESLLTDRFLSEFNRKPFGKNKNEVISNWCEKINNIASQNKIEAVSLAEKAIDTIIEVHKKSRTFIPSVNVLLGNKYFEMIRDQVSKRNLGITKTEQLIKERNIKPLTLPKEYTINLISDKKFIKGNTVLDLLARKSFEETFYGRRITSITDIPPKPIKGNFTWELVTLLMHIKKKHKEIPVTKRIIKEVEKVLFSVLLHNHKEELKSLYYKDYKFTPEYTNHEILMILINLWEECRDKVKNNNIPKYIKKQNVVDDVIYFLGFKPVIVPLRKFGTAIDVKYSYSYCILLMKAFAMGMNQLLYKGETILEPLFKKLAYIYDCKSLSDILKLNLHLYKEIKNQKTGEILKRYNHYVNEKVFYLLEKATSRTVIYRINNKIKKELKKNLIPNIPIKGLKGHRDAVIRHLMKKYKVPHINPSNI